MDGFSQQYIPATLDGLNVVDADQLYIGGEEVKLDNYVPYMLANKTVDLNSQNIKTTHYAAASSDLVNLQVLTDAIQYVDTANALTYVNKVTGATQTMNAELHGPNFTASGRLTVWDGGSKYYNARVEVSGEDFVIQRDDAVNPIVDILKYDLSANKWIFTEGVASKVPIWDADKGLVSSGVDSSKITYLDNVSSDIQTQLNNRLQLSGGTMTGNIVMGANKITSAYNPVNAEDMTRKGYVDTAISSATAGKANLAGGNTFTGDQIFNTGTVSVNTRLLGLPDGSPGNFWIGLRGSGTEVQRLAISINGSDTTGIVDRVIISKTLRLNQPTANRVLTVNSDGDVVSSTVTPTTLSYLDATSSIQTQLNSKVAKAGDTMTGQLQISTTGFAPLMLTRTSAGANYGVGTIHSLIGTLGFQGYYARTLGGSNGAVATTAQSQCNGYYLIDVANAGVFGSDTSPDNSTVYITASSAKFKPDINALANLYASGNVGVGVTSSLVARLQVNNAGGTDFLTLQNTNYTFNDYINQRFLFGDPAGSNRSAYFQAVLTSSNETDLLFYVSSSAGGVTERFRIKGNSDSLFNGKVGIGTDAPVAPLHIKASGGGNPAANGLYVYNPTNTAGQDAIVSVRVAGTSGGNPYVSFDVAGEAGWAWGMDNSDNSMKLASSWDTLATNPRLRIQNNGDTIFANYIPYQNANFIVSRSGTSTSFAVVAGNENDNAILYLGTPHVPTDSANSAYKCALIADGNGNWSTSNLHFCLNGTTGSNDVSQNANLTHSRMMIKGTTGDVGIGTNDPAVPLDVAGFCRIRNTLLVGMPGDVASVVQFGGPPGDTGYDHCQLKCRTYNSGGEGSELVIFKGNDIQSGSLLPDRVRIRGANVCFDTYPNFSTNPDDENIRMTINQNGQVGIGTASPVGVLDIYNASADYTNSVVIRTQWSSVTLDNTLAGGRKWSILAGGPNAGVQLGGFGVFDLIAGAYRLGISPGGVITFYGDAVTTGNQYLNTVNQPSQTTFNNTENRLLFRDPGTGLTTTGACSTWNITYTTVAWTYGLWIDYLVYIPNTTCTIQIDITGSGYSAGVVAQTVFEIILYPMFVGTPYVQYGIPFFFNQTYSHTQATLHVTIPNNAWGASTVGWKRMYAQWIYASGGAIASDANDTLNMNIRVIG